ncbi:MAG: methyltransferase domain-containing protein [Myxococcota bacterium]
MVKVRVSPLPDWVPVGRFLGPRFTRDGAVATADLTVSEAADVAARLRGVGLGGRLLDVGFDPPLPRAAVRAARTEDARRRRDTTPGFTRPGVRLDEEGRFSLTPEALARALAKPLAGRAVVDATCGAGGNTIGFARAGARVTAIERDARRLADARANAAVYGVADRVRFLHGDARVLVPTLSADLLFVDPPWGVDWSRDRVGLADVPLLAELLPLARGRYPAVWAKVPPAFDPADWPEASVEAVFGAAAGDTARVKFLVLREGRLPE